MIEGFRLEWIWCGSHQGSWSNAPGTSLGGEKGYTNGDNHDFWWITQGRTVFNVDGRTYHANGPKDIILLRPWQVIKTTYDPLEPTAGRFFRFVLTSVPARWPKPQTWPVKREMPSDDIIRPLFEYVAGHTPAQSGEPPLTVVLAVQTMMSAFICGPLERSHSPAQAYPDPVMKALRWMWELMDSKPRQKVTLAELAEIADVSAKHLCRLFAQSTGRSPIDMLYLYRLSRSLEGLRAGQKIESLAHDCGFASAAHFASRFREVYRKTPTQMQKAMGKGYTPKPLQLPFL